MSVWLCRAGFHAEHEREFIGQEKIFLICAVETDLTGKTEIRELTAAISGSHPAEPGGSVTAMATQARAFAAKAKTGDWVVVPGSGPEKLLNIGEITGGYEYDGTKKGLEHSRRVDWKYGVWERSVFDEKTQRSLDAFEAFMVFFKLSRDEHIRDIVLNGTPYLPITPPTARPASELHAHGSGPGAETGAEHETGRGPKRSINKPEPETEDDAETLFAEDEGFGDNAWTCPCGKKSAPCYKYNRWYYDILKARRCFRR